MRPCTWCNPCSSSFCDCGPCQNENCDDCREVSGNKAETSICVCEGGRANLHGHGNTWNDSDSEGAGGDR